MDKESVLELVLELIRDINRLTNPERCRFLFEFKTVLLIEEKWNQKIAESRAEDKEEEGFN